MAELLRTEQLSHLVVLLLHLQQWSLLKWVRIKLPELGWSRLRVWLVMLEV
jgi:hypothetical protein